MCICLCSVSYCSIQILLQSVLDMLLQFLCFWLPLAYCQHIVTRGKLILVVSSGFVGLGFLHSHLQTVHAKVEYKDTDLMDNLVLFLNVVFFQSLVS